MDIQLNCVSPWDKRKPYPKQQQYLSINRKSSDVTHVDWVGGWGSAKTHTAVLEAFMAAYVWMPNMPGLVTEPTHKKIKMNFLPLWQQIVPTELYQINWSDMIIRSKVNQSIIYLCSRNVDNPARSKEALAGVNVAWAIDDESGEKCRVEAYNQIEARVRLNTPYRFHSTTSTPAMGHYQQIVNRPDHIRIHSSSYENPHVPKNYAENLASQLSEQYKRLCIDAEFVPLSGMLWPDWSNEPWPRGNIHPHVHDHGLPYYLAFDIGVATSAWLVLQPVGDVWVVTAEFLPMRDGSIQTVAADIMQQYGPPSGVVVGSDIATRASTDAETGRYIVRRTFGSDMPVRQPSGAGAMKEIQHMQLSYGIKSANGLRRFCVSKDLRSKPKRSEHNRGILEVMTQDAWPDDIRSDDWHAIHNELSHMRDAAMYFAAALAWPPRFTRLDKVA